MDAEIVVAHYNEDLTWLRRFRLTPIHVYSKGNLATISCFKHILPNIGREAHTYLSYIIERYDTLPRIVFFTQGKIFDHIRGVNISRIFLGITKCSSNYVFTTEPHDFRITDYRGALKPAECVFDEWFHKYVDDTVDIKSGINVYYAAIFSVCREKILSRPKSFYEELIKQLDENNTEVAHYFERSWYYIFNLHRD